MTEMKPENGEGPLTKVFLAVAVWIFLVVMVLVQWGRVPKTAVGWVCLVVVGPAAWLAGQAFFDWLFSDRHGKAVSDRKFSIGRMAIAFVVMVVAIVAGAIIDAVLSGGE